MTRTVFNNNFNLGNVESFKFLPDELQDCIGEYVEEAINIKNSTIAKYLNLPPVKLHCSMLAEDAIKAAVKDYENKKK